MIKTTFILWNIINKYNLKFYSWDPQKNWNLQEQEWSQKTFQFQELWGQSSQASNSFLIFLLILLFWQLPLILHVWRNQEDERSFCIPLKFKIVPCVYNHDKMIKHLLVSYPCPIRQETSILIIVKHEMNHSKLSMMLTWT